MAGPTPTPPQTFVTVLGVCDNFRVSPVPVDSTGFRTEPLLTWRLNGKPSSPAIGLLRPVIVQQLRAENASASSDKRSQQTLHAPSATNGNHGTGSQATPPRPLRQDSSDNLKSFKVSLDDPAWKVLPAALKKYKINNDDWQNYAMFICYGSPGKVRIYRVLTYDGQL